MSLISVKAYLCFSKISLLWLNVILLEIFIKDWKEIIKRKVKVRDYKKKIHYQKYQSKSILKTLDVIIEIIKYNVQQ